jgi:hypothetical protein
VQPQPKVVWKVSSRQSVPDPFQGEPGDGVRRARLLVELAVLPALLREAQPGVHGPYLYRSGSGPADGGRLVVRLRAAAEVQHGRGDRRGDHDGPHRRRQQPGPPPGAGRRRSRRVRTRGRAGSERHPVRRGRRRLFAGTRFAAGLREGRRRSTVSRVRRFRRRHRRPFAAGQLLAYPQPRVEFAGPGAAGPHERGDEFLARQRGAGEHVGDRGTRQHVPDRLRPGRQLPVGQARSVLERLHRSDELGRVAYPLRIRGTAPGEVHPLLPLCRPPAGTRWDTSRTGNSLASGGG